MRRSAILVATAVAVLLALEPASAATCEVYRNRLAFTADTNVDMIVLSGKDCRVRFPLADKVQIDSNEVTARPRYGGVRTDGTSGAYYRSNPGYRGQDQFTFTLCGVEGDKSGCSNIRVKVTVR